MRPQVILSVPVIIINQLPLFLLVYNSIILLLEVTAKAVLVRANLFSKSLTAKSLSAHT